MNIAHEIERRIRRHTADLQFVATVAAVSGNTIQITRPGQTSADGQYYAAAEGLAQRVAIGDRVLVHRAGAGYTVGYKVVS